MLKDKKVNFKTSHLKVLKKEWNEEQINKAFVVQNKCSVGKLSPCLTFVKLLIFMSDLLFLAIF